jgi:hypothetical protein
MHLCADVYMYLSEEELRRLGFLCIAFHDGLYGEYHNYVNTGSLFMEHKYKEYTIIIFLCASSNFPPSIDV